VSPGDANERKPAKGKRPAHRPASTAKPRALTISKAKRDKWLALVADGTHPGDAARQIDPTYTGRLFKSLAHHDAKFAAAREAALGERRHELVDKARNELETRQLGDDVTLKSDRGLHNLMILIDADYRAAHRQNGPTVNVTTEMEVTHVHIAGKADELRRHLAEVVDIDAARVASRARPALHA
jgi:hypothetical protein